MPARAKKNRQPEKKRAGQFRVIAGTWRSRRLAFPDIDGLRPTTDRVRETVFNWLRAEVPGSRLLDLFAGSGALAFEALSRGAEQATMVELNRQAAQSLKDNIKLLDAKAELQQADALQYLATATGPYDLVFLDPPFRKGLLAPCIEGLQKPGLLAPGAKIYIEQESEQPAVQVPASWRLLKENKAGQVLYLLYEASASE